MVNPKNSFWLALVFTIIIFLLGLTFGYFIEIYKADVSEEKILGSEIELLDYSTRAELYKNLNLSCEPRMDAILKNADEIYYNALELERYEDSAKFTTMLLLLHKRYDLLRASLWIDYNLVRKSCRQDVHVLLYLFEYKTEDVELKSMQGLYSRILSDMKSKHSDKIILLPVAMDLDLGSVDFIEKANNVSQAPAIIIDDNLVIQGRITFDELESIIFNRNKQ